MKLDAEAQPTINVDRSDFKRGNVWFELLLEELQSERKRRNRKLVKSIQYLIYLPLFFASIINLMFMISGKDPPLFPVTSILPIFNLILISVYYLNKKHRAMLLELAEFDDLRAVGTLTEALEIEDKKVREAASLALQRLLPRLQTTDSNLLSKEQRAILNRRLNIILHFKAVIHLKSKEALAKAILKAYEQVGDKEALSIVMKLAQSKNSQQLQRAAEECIPFLQARISREQDQESLLRASSPAHTASASYELLRPAEGTDATEHAEELLRASSGNGEKAL